MNIKIQNGTFSYDKNTKLLNNINLEIKQGDIVSILGPNGVGKTTFLKCLLSFEKWDKGNTLIDEKDISSYNQKQLFQNISYVPQAKVTTFSYTVFETVLLGRSSYLSMFETPKDIDKQKALEAIQLCGIDHLKDKYTNQISGGELQLVFIARALCSNPQIIVLDEAETGLDYSNQLKILTLLKKLSKENNITVIFNTHYPEHALDISDKSLLLNNDGSYLFGETKDIITEKNLSETFGVDVIMLDKNVDGNNYHALIATKEREDS